MAAITATKHHCPHCKRRMSLFGVPQHKLRFCGCRLRYCKRCGGRFVDTRIEEIGLLGREETCPRWNQFYLGWFVYYLVVTAGFAGIAFRLKTVPGAALLLLVELLLVSLAVQIIINLMTLNWRKKRWQEEYSRSAEFLRKREER